MPRGARGDAPEVSAAGLPPGRALELADRLVAQGRPFTAHEVLEEVWRRAGADRPLWRGLAQLAVGLTHAQRGNLRGAVALLRRGADNVESAPAGAVPEVPPELPGRARELADRLAEGGLPGEAASLSLFEQSARRG